MTVPFGFGGQGFTEERNQQFYHNLRIYISGADVTPYLTGNIAVSYGDRDGINSCTFTLSNAGQVFEITQANLDGVWNLKDDPKVAYSATGLYSEYAKYTIYNRKLPYNTPHAIKSFGPVRSTGQTGQILTGASTKRSSSQASSTSTKRYPFNKGSLVLHKYDPIRVFAQDPLQRDPNNWYVVFTGYIDTKPFATDYVKGISQIRVTAQDIRLLMQGMRVQINPVASIGNENTLRFTRTGTPVQDTVNAGFFNDLIAPNYTVSHVLGRTTFLQSIDFLIFGLDPQTRASGTATTTSSLPPTATTPASSLGAVGKLKKGNPYLTRYNPGASNAKDVMRKWNNIVQFGSESLLSEVDMITMGQGTYDSGPYSPDNAFVYMLVPATGAPQSNLIESSIDTQVNTRIDWSSRLELLNQLCKTIDYQFYINGRGDFIFEFPMYDFMPYDYGDEYNRLYSFSAHIMSDDINDEGGKPISGLSITSRDLRGEISTGNPTNADETPVANSLELTRTIFSNVLASRVGVQIETHFVPGITDQDRLNQLGIIEFNKRIANFDSFALNASYRPFIGVNRPLYHALKERIGIVKSLSYNWTIRGEANMDATLEYTRKRENDGAFRFITGGEASTISYNKVYDKFLTGQGLNSTDGGLKGNGNDS